MLKAASSMPSRRPVLNLDDLVVTLRNAYTDRGPLRLLDQAAARQPGRGQGRQRKMVEAAAENRAARKMAG